MTQRIVSVTVQAPDKAINLNDRGHHMAKARRVATWREAGFWWAKQHRLRCTRATSVVEVWFEFGTNQPNRRRDPSNWTPTVKAVLDGFTDAAVWEDDDSRHVKTYEPIFSADVPVGSIKIILSWEEPE